MDKEKGGVFVYADESGHSGKDIFNEGSPLYYQGSVISVGDIEPVVSPIVAKYCDENGLERLHGFELGEQKVNALCKELLDALKEIDWQFHYTVIEKRYIAPTKFVDTIFDSYDNPAVHPLWYLTDLFRHTLCVLIDDMMEEDELDKKFWSYYLADDIDGLIEISKVLLERAPFIFDARACEVVTDGLIYAIDNREIFTLTAAKGKSAYKKETPNIVAFSSLLTAIHRFCKPKGLSVSALVHDQSDEFKGTMREYHKTFFGVDYEDDKFGGVPQFERVEYGLGEFKLESSKKSSGLQVVDLFLWLIQRDIKDQNLLLTKSHVIEKSENFRISRGMSLAIIKARQFQLMQQELSLEELEAGKRLNKKILANQSAKMKK